MDWIFEMMRRDAIDSARFLRWLGRHLHLLDMAPCRACSDNPLRSCQSCYRDGFHPH